MGHAMVWDSARGRALLFGGDGDFGTAFAGAWQLLSEPLPHWVPLATLGPSPLPRTGAAVVLDAKADRVLLFGGRKNGYGEHFNDLWELRLSTTPEWRRLEVASGTLPIAREGATLFLDRERRLVLCGGLQETYGDSTLWILPLEESPLRWRPVTLPGLGPRTRHSAAYSAIHHRMVVFAGERPVERRNYRTLERAPAETWELELTEPMTWTRGHAEPNDSVPLPQSGGALVADRSGGTAWLIQGFRGHWVDDRSVWRYDFATRSWLRSHTGTGGPSFLGRFAACLDPATDRIVVHGGGQTPLDGLASFVLGETRAFVTAPEPGWTELAPGPVSEPDPDLGYDPTAHFDAERRQLLTWTRRGVWTLDAAGLESWTLAPSDPGRGPSLRYSMRALDPARRRLLVFGGLRDHLPVPADTLWSWSLDGNQGWTSIPIQGTAPAGIVGRQCAFDAARSRVWVVPSSLYEFVSLDSLPALEVGEDWAKWRRVPVLGTPPIPRYHASVVLDEANDRLILQGGGDPVPFDGRATRDLWSLELGTGPTWEERMYHPTDYGLASLSGLVVDPTLDRLMVVGGEGVSIFDIGSRNALRSAALDELSTWMDLDPVHVSPMSGRAVALFDAAADRVLWWSGRALWELTWPLGDPAPYGPAQVIADAFAVHVRWAGTPTGPYAAVIERSLDGGRSWTRIRAVNPGADGSLEFSDSLVVEKAAASYRAVVHRGGNTKVLGVASLASGRGLPNRFALAPPRPNPASGSVTLELRSPTDARVKLELFDLSGRRVGAPLVRRIGAGTTALTIPLAQDLGPGLYILRASDGKATSKQRLAVIR